MNIKCKILGVEPTDKANLANSNGVNSIQKFFSEKTVDDILLNYPRADIITAANVFAHITNIHDVVKGVKS